MSASTPQEPGLDQSAGSGLGAFPRQPRLSDRVAHDIVQTIIAHHLKPGDALPPERELGEQFGVSRTVIREAVRALDARGILEVRVGSRIKVATVNPRTVCEALWHFARTAILDERAIAAVSTALEVAAAAAAADRATESDLERINASVAATDGDVPAHGALGFRRAVAAASHNELLIVLLDAIAGLAPREQPSGTTPGRRRAVATAIAERDPDRAERAMRELLRRPAPRDTGGD